MNVNEKYKIIALELENMVQNQLIPFSTYLYYFNEYLLAKFDGTVNTETLNNIANSLIYCAVIDVNDEELF